jgi:hypothetical protein
MTHVTIIERLADPLPGGRAQLVETVYEDGVQVERVRRGSPAAEATVRKVEEVLTMTDAGTFRARQR